MKVQWRELTDDLGPAKVLVMHDIVTGLRAVLVVDNVACGPSIGGVRMSLSVSVDEVQRLARAMTFKSAAAGLPHGGGKAGIIADPRMEPIAKERLIRAFARAIAGVTDYIPGPDMGTDETCMAYVHDEIGRAVGLPRSIGGIPLDEIGATGLGLAAAAEVARKHAGGELAGTRFVMQGFGAVGTHGARFLAERGAILVAAADSGGGVVNVEGLDVAALLAHKRAGASVHTFVGGKPIQNKELLAVPCDMWCPAAQPDVITADNQATVRAKLIVPGANIAVTAEAERLLHERGVVVIPDFIANAGGLICAAVEHQGGTQAQALATIREKVAANTQEVLDTAGARVQLPRAAAVAMARARVEDAARYRRSGIPVAHRANLMLDM